MQREASGCRVPSLPGRRRPVNGTTLRLVKSTSPGGVCRHPAGQRRSVPLFELDGLRMIGTASLCDRCGEVVHYRELVTA